MFDDIRNRSFYSSQSPIAWIADKESANHTINVRLKEPYDENLKRLNECVAKTFPNVALNFNSVDSMIREGYKSVYRFRNAVWISSCFILLIVITGLIGYVNGEKMCIRDSHNPILYRKRAIPYFRHIVFWNESG